MILMLALTGQDIDFRASIFSEYLPAAHITISGPASRSPLTGCGRGATQIEPGASSKANAGCTNSKVKRIPIARFRLSSRRRGVFQFRRFWQVWHFWQSLAHLLSSFIGTFTPLFSAKSAASSYPASTCRATPIPGSFVSTRSMRFAIISVPSATVTCPACNE